jgi:hypothetical protein
VIEPHAFVPRAGAGFRAGCLTCGKHNRCKVHHMPGHKKSGQKPLRPASSSEAIEVPEAPGAPTVTVKCPMCSGKGHFTVDLLRRTVT